MDAEEAIRSRRTVKAFDRRPVGRETLQELLELARWAPNHNLTNPWRFRVLGPQALERLKQAAGVLAADTAPAGADPVECARVAAAKLDRAPTLVVCSVHQTGDDVQDEEDLHAAGVAAYIVLLGAHTRGLAGYWRTPGVLRTDAGRSAVGLEPDERFVGLLYLGHAVQAADPPAREPVERYAEFLD
ncbi:MAG TPA: nitroreductase [Solirubrobacterales bacterium]|nr:nitroreductase [Solirubrobacterales bacterium]